MDFQSAMETFAEAWVAANTKGGPLGDVGCSQNQAMALTRGCKTPPSPPPQQQPPPPPPALRLSSEPPPGARSPPPLAASTPKQDSLLLVNPKDEYDVAKGASGLASGRSLPVHCVVEAVAALGGDGKLGWKRRPVVETDSYVIIPANTAFHDLVAVALARLGYPTDSASAAKGTVVIKNWKPLNFDKITDGAQATVEDILGELTTVATLRIELYRARPSVLSDIKDKLLRLLLLQSHGLLLTAGCPLDEVTLSQLCRGAVGAPGLQPPPLEPSEDMRRKFEQWWTLQMAQQAASAGGPGRVPPGQPQFSPGGPHAVAPPGVVGAKPLERPPSLPDAVHPALQTVQSQYPTQKTRMRTSFDPELELPKLQRWFAENQHPSRQQIQQYVKELNGLESRRGRKPLDVNNVVYWFKNARAAQKRAELRGVGPGLSCSLSLNGYNSSSHSPPGALLGSESLVHHDKSPGSPSLHSPSGGRMTGTGGGSGSGGGGGGSGGGGSGAGTPAGAGSGGGYAHSENSGGASDQEDDDEQDGRGGGGDSQHGPQPPPPPPPPPPLAQGSRPEHPEGRGDPRAELPGHEDMDDGPGSPAAPLSLTTNDKDPLAGGPAASPHLQGSPQLQCDFSPRRSPLEGRRSAFSPTAAAFDGRRSAFTRSPWAVPLQADIKQEPPEEAPSPAPSNNNNNNNNNGSVKEMEEGSDAEEDEEEEEMEEGDERRLGLKEEPADPGTVALRAPDRALRPFRTPSPPDVLGRGPPGPGLAPAGFPLVPNSMFSHSIMYMSHYIPGLAGHGLPPGAAPPSSSGGGPAGLNLTALAASAADERRKRNRTFIDPVTEVPRLEQWFALNTHPSHNLILKYTEELNRMPYRQKFPRLEPKNVQFWFKNRRAKCKRLKMSLFENGPGAAAAAAAVAAGVNHQHHHPNPYHHSPPGGRD